MCENNECKGVCNGLFDFLKHEETPSVREEVFWQAWLIGPLGPSKLERLRIAPAAPAVMRVPGNPQQAVVA